MHHLHLYALSQSSHNATASSAPSSPSTALVDLRQPRTSAHGHLASPAAVRAADSVLRPPGEEITWLTGVHQGVTVGRKVQTHDVGVGRAPRLLAGVSWWASRRQKRVSTHTHKSGQIHTVMHMHFSQKVKYSNCVNCWKCNDRHRSSTTERLGRLIIIQQQLGKNKTDLKSFLCFWN